MIICVSAEVWTGRSLSSSSYFPAFAVVQQSNLLKLKHSLMQGADLQVALSMTNAVVCFAVMLFPCSAVEIAGTSPIRADNDFIG